METDNHWKMDSFLEEDRFKSTMTIQKAINLLKDKHAAKMIERHVRALNRISNNNRNGYMLKDLLSLCELITVCNEKLKISNEYAAPLLKIIAGCKLPFLKEKMSDEVTYAPCVIEILSLFGRMITVATHPTIRLGVITTVGEFYEGNNANTIEIPDDVQQSRVAYNMTMVERSAIVRSITKGLNIVVNSSDNDTGELIGILNTLAIFSGNSITNCDHILSVNGGETLTKLLIATDNKIVMVSIEILWNLLEKGSRLQINEQLGSFEATKNFQGLFKHLMLRSTGNQMKQLRNDLVSLMTLLASSSSSLSFVETGFLADICDFINRSDVLACSTITHLADYNLTSDPEDFELVKLLICLLMSLCSLPAATIILSQTNVMQSIFSYIIPNDTENTKWNSAQFEEIQLLCLSCLSLLSPLCIHDYMDCQGSTSLLLLIEWCSKGEHFGGHGNSFHGNGGRGNKLSELRYCLRVLLSVSTISNNSLVLQDLHEQGVIPLLIDLLKHLVTSPNSDNNSVLIEIQSDCLLILSCLCHNDNHRKELFGGYEGIPILMTYLKKDPNNFSIRCGHDRLLLSAVDCTWSTVIGNNIVEDIFLENGGIFSLMDMLQKSPHKMQGLLLGVLVDLCDNPKSLSHATAWQGMDSTNCWSLLARLWNKEEKNLGVTRDMGTLAGTTLPLVGAEQNALGMPPLPTRQPSAAINDISSNNRAKLYALCSKIGFNYPVDSMVTEEKITMCIIENYLSFKTGEVWYEVAGELAQEGLRPTTPDQEDLQEILQSFEERAEDVIKQQHELMDEQHRNDLEEEYQFYEKLRDGQFSKERALEKREKLILRTSNIKHLKEAKERQGTIIDASRPSNISLGERFHTTDLDYSSLNVTAFCGRHVSVPNKTITS